MSHQVFLGEHIGFEEFFAEKVLSWSLKGIKLINSRVFAGQGFTGNEIKKVLSSTEKSARLFDKR